MQCVRPLTLAYMKNSDKSKSYSSFVRGVKKNKIKEVQLYPKHNLIRYTDEDGNILQLHMIRRVNFGRLWRVVKLK